MSDTPKTGLQFAGGGTPANTPPAPEPSQPAQGEQQSGEQVQYITRAEALSMIQEATNRIGQSVSDKATARIQKEVARLQKAGIQATPEQVQALVQDEVEQPQAQPSSKQPTQGQPAGSEAPNPVVVTAEGMMRAAGIDPNNLNESDPDYGIINFQGDEVEFLASIKSFIGAKTAKRGSPARIPVMGAGTAAGGGKAALVAEMDKLTANPRPENLPRMREIAELLKR